MNYQSKVIKKGLVKIMVANKLLSQELDPAQILDDRFIKNSKL